MLKKGKYNSHLEEEPQETEAFSGAGDTINAASQEAADALPELDPLDELRSENDRLVRQAAELQDRYLRLAAEFDNFRKRTLKEKADLIQSAGGDILKNILPVMDDFERSLQVMETSTDIEGLRQGVLLIHSKFKDFLSRQGVKEMCVAGDVFDADVHEALTTIPAPKEQLKGKVVDVIQKGYSLNDKIIRFAQVVVGQ